MGQFRGKHSELDVVVDPAHLQCHLLADLPTTLDQVLKLHGVAQQVIIRPRDVDQLHPIAIGTRSRTASTPLVGLAHLGGELPHLWHGAHAQALIGAAYEPRVQGEATLAPGPQLHGQQFQQQTLELGIKFQLLQAQRQLAENQLPESALEHQLPPFAADCFGKTQSLPVEEAQ
eukprot:CAMPEP_0181418194 /NCGR_PEP_ID=MMETSP1110-20121109/11429_1 /TAXON_ID=174948 /ORGANISM="Symbiodinium sp., Strain CCMP421" /LENGTH=173 /DNA_ID=CAMNT_0023541165 /DNA_START=272 /DNA_END=790 /DNA_ORIENTATION=+